MSKIDTSQKSLIGIPASPLTSSTPNTFLLSAMQLGRSYLQSRDVSYLGHAIRLLRPFGGRAVAKLGLGAYDEMIETDPQVAQGVDILQMASTANSVSFGIPDEAQSGKAEDLAGGALRHVQDIYGQMDCDFDEERAKLTYDLIRYGNGFAELEFREGANELEGYLAIKQIHSVAVEDVVIITDSYNRIVGYAPYGFPGVVAPLDSWVPADSFVSYLFDAFDNQAKREGYVTEVEILPKWKVWHAKWQGLSNDPRGKALLDTALHPWWAKQQIMSVLLMLIEEWGRPSTYGTLPDKADDVCIYGADGRPAMDAKSGQPLMRSGLITLNEALGTMRGGGTAALPFDYKLNLLEINPALIDSIIGALDFFNIEISKAILKQHLASGEGQRGSEKGADSHGDILSMLILHAKNKVSRSCRNEVFAPIVAANFGPEFKKYTPTVDLGDADGMPITLSEIGFLTQSNYFSADQLPAMDRRIGVPVRSRHSADLPRSAINDVNKINQILAAKLFGAEVGDSISLRITK